MHQIRAISLYSYLEVASFVGIDGHALLAKVGIPAASLDDPQNRLPAAPAVRLLEQSAEESRCDSFGIRMAQCRSFASLGPISVLLDRLATIGEVLEAFAAGRRSLSDVLFMEIESTAGSISAKFDLVSPFSRPQAADLTVGLGYIALSGASGGRWSPESVHFTHDTPADRRTFEAFFRAPLVFNSTFNGFVFPSQDLDIALPMADPGMAENARYLLRGLPLPPEKSTTSDHTRHAIMLLLPEGRASLGEVARNLDISPRALQRRLKIEGRAFAGLLNEVRRNLVRLQLQRSDQPLTAVAQALGYADLSSFTRWFDGEFGTSPSAWRKEQKLLAQRPPPVSRR